MVGETTIFSTLWDKNNKLLLKNFDNIKING